jgi:2-polyprenyl-6-methoxyphenol hydroxylase-like FAD-dependent oxidoreductase
MDMAHKAIIIGAGIGGLSAGLALQQAGYAVEIYERAPALKSVGAGISLWANAIKALDQLGVGERVRAMGMAEGGGGFHTPNGRTLLAIELGEVERRFGAPTIVLHRAELSQILLESYTGALQLGKRFTHYEEDASGVTATFADGTQASGDLLVCADGIHSVLRQSWFPNSHPRYAGYTAWRGVLPFDHQRVVRHWGETLGRGTRVGIAPLSEGRIYWFATQNLPENTRIAPQDQHAHLLALFGTWYAPIPDLIRGTPSEEILQNDIYDLDPLDEWVRGRVALLGDSAHAMTPNMGQGGCQAIEDAVVLGKCLRLALTIAEALQRYQSQRLPHANHVLRTSRRIGQAVTIANPLVCALRDTLFRLMPAKAQLRNLESVAGFEV